MVVDELGDMIDLWIRPETHIYGTGMLVLILRDSRGMKSEITLFEPVLRVRNDVMINYVTLMWVSVIFSVVRIFSKIMVI